MKIIKANKTGLKLYTYKEMNIFLVEDPILPPNKLMLIK